MRIEKANPVVQKGWYLGQWNSELTISVGFANTGIDEPHVHSQIREIYLVARGTSRIRIDQQTFDLAPGDLLLLEPGEAHTFLASSPDYFHFVIHTPGLSRESAQGEKLCVPRSRLGLIASKQET